MKRNRIKTVLMEADKALERAKHNIGIHNLATDEDIKSAIDALKSALKELRIEVAKEGVSDVR